jgi:hypothetical protein
MAKVINLTKPYVIQTQGLIALILGRTEINVHYVEHLVESGELELFGWIFKQLKDMRETDPTVSNCGEIKDILYAIENGEIESVGLSTTACWHYPGFKM